MISGADTVPEVTTVVDKKTSLQKSDDLESESAKADTFWMMPAQKHSPKRILCHHQLEL